MRYHGNPTSRIFAEACRCFLARKKMGLYWQTLLYHGRMLSADARERLVSARLPHMDRFLRKVAKDRWILHAPNKCIVMGSIDPILEDREKRAGQVSKQEVEKWLAGNPEAKEKWSSVFDEDMARLRELIVIAANGDEQAVPDTYIAEIDWTTLDLSEDGGLVTYNLKVV
jgi:hypothetical protein